MANAKDPTKPPGGWPMAYNDFYKTNGSSTVVYFDGPTMTRQEFKDEADINVLMAKYQYQGVPPPLPGVEPSYVDFTQMPSGLMDMMEMLGQATNAFMQLPADVRKAFDNSAYAFVDFASDPANLDQMRSWGLAPSAVPPVAKAPEVPASPPGSSAPPAGDSPAGGAPSPGTHTST